jgi:hypothetical protein
MIERPGRSYVSKMGNTAARERACLDNPAPSQFAFQIPGPDHPGATLQASRKRAIKPNPSRPKGAMDAVDSTRTRAREP